MVHVVQTVAVLSLKGGVGKTTIALGLASAALRRGARTLVVDLDPQCNATATLDPHDTKATLADVLEPVENCLNPTQEHGHARPRARALCVID